jgi:hypothetical protein
MIQVSATAVKCAAQLYYAMTIGDELDVFNVVNYFTHKYLIRGVSKFKTVACETICKCTSFQTSSLT